MDPYQKSAPGVKASSLRGLNKFLHSSGPRTKGGEINFLTRLQGTWQRVPSSLLLVSWPCTCTTLFPFGMRGRSQRTRFNDARDDFHRGLNVLVGMTSVDDCCSSGWEVIRWEILNSCAIQEWERAEQLFRKSEVSDVRDRTNLWGAHAVYSFVTTIATEHLDQLYSLEWEPVRLEAANQEWNFLLFNSSLIDQSKHVTAKPDQVKVWDIIPNLQKATQQQVDLLAYRSMLARCYLAANELETAAKHYAVLAESSPTFFGIDFTPAACLSAAKAYRLAADPSLAEEFIRRGLTCGKRAGDTAKSLQRSLLLELADLQAQEAKFGDAYLTLRQAVEIDPSIEDSLGVRVALAKGALPHNGTAELTHLLESMGFSKIKEALAKAQKDLDNHTPFDWKAAADLLRSCIEEAHTEVVRHLEAASSKAYNGEKDGDRRKYMKDAKFISDHEAKFAAHVYGFISEESAHSLELAARDTAWLIDQVVRNYLFVMLRRLNTRRNASQRPV